MSKATATKPAAKKATPAKKVVAKKAATPNKELDAALAAQGPFVQKAPSKEEQKAAKKTVPAPAKPENKGAEGDKAAPSKADIARALFKKMNGKNTRQEILKAFQDEAKLTPAGSATYYANLKKELTAP